MFQERFERRETETSAHGLNMLKVREARVPEERYCPYQDIQRGKTAEAVISK